ncbi:hypothetical protein EDEG_02972 [Edhazardia aedis USNM 41457]|uniref:Proteasome subunit beta n=1 Tax=Edhazardia aedis (strain USNM 41457) TaxID=1003232 RepID=J9DJ56_EDHAE|nr:hypothetical protein EDEG_02972 [Edhazardia aedis USNM 41457]|eukprot:EJW02630.1 hypothetical protein EDEG_02972 [Edhazardia aedis USNM 41457]
MRQSLITHFIPPKMDSLIAIRCKNFVLSAHDTNTGSSFLLHKTDHNKFYELPNTVISYFGDQSEGYRLCEFISELAIYESTRHNIKTDPKLVSNLMQKRIHDFLRKRNLGVGCIVCGKADNGFDLYYVDPYGAMATGNYFCAGYSTYFGYGVLDKNYNFDMTKEDAIKIVKNIVECMNKRLVLGYKKFNIKIISDEGTEDSFIEVGK